MEKPSLREVQESDGDFAWRCRDGNRTQAVLILQPQQASSSPSLLLRHLFHSSSSQRFQALETRGSIRHGAWAQGNHWLTEGRSEQATVEGVWDRAVCSHQSTKEGTSRLAIQVRLWEVGDICLEGEWELSRCRRPSKLRTLPPKLISGKNRPWPTMSQTGISFYLRLAHWFAG